MSRLTDKEHLLGKQYVNGSSLSARVRIHSFGTNKQPWFLWIFDQLDLPPRCRILELGCGNGAFWQANINRVPRGWKIMLTDFSPGMLEEARQNLSGAGRPFRFEAVDAQSIPFGDESFDVVIALHMLYHVPDRGKALSEIRQVLRPDGRFYASTGGQSHMRELWDLVSRLAPGVDRSRNEPAENFGLENGREQLERVFSDVELRRYEDSLVVPEAQPLVDYVLSTGSTEADLSDFRQAVEEEIRLKGAVRITKDVGLFIAR